jgi:hypothetical protein
VRLQPEVKVSFLRKSDTKNFLTEFCSPICRKWKLFVYL